MIICAAHEVSKMFGGTKIFEQLSFEIHENDRVGLVGRNGSGKTTIFKLLAGIEAPDSGQIHIKKDCKVGYLEQIPSYTNQVTVYEVLASAFSKLKKMENEMRDLETRMASERDETRLNQLIKEYGSIQDQFTYLGGYEVETNIQKVVNGLKIDYLLNSKFDTLSGGEKTKVGLGLILLQNPDLLLLDEPTNHLDIAAVEWLEEYLRDYNGTVVVISHDRYFLDQVVTKILDLEEGELEIYRQNYSGFLKEKEEKLLLEFQAYQEQQKKIKKMKETIKRLREWANQANPPNAGLHKRASSMEKALERMEKLKRPVLEAKKMELRFEQHQRSGNDVVFLKDAAISFNGMKLFSGINMNLQFQDRAVIVGENGTGKSTILKLLLKELTPDDGEMKVGSNVKIGYLSQVFQAKDPEQTIIEAFRDEVRVTEGEARHILARFLFYGPAVFQKIKGLSGGEKMRLRLAQLMYQDINFLILDEPTNHLDIDSREVLEDALEKFNGTILAVSHDRYFIDKLFSKTYWLTNNTLYAFPGDYSWARKKLKEILPKEENLAVSNTKSAGVTNKGSVAKDKAPQIELEIEDIEEKLRAIEKQMLAEQDLPVLQELTQEQQKLEEVREKLYEALETVLIEESLRK
ncbi:ATPase subunit of ABC transporter with duplicated ATPase domains [Bacillus oleivorans]|uniref:ATPase subunit of ABC transporter with duplicated ATPase domains n=1 Tax=Bacillus oleivorans TaxID=1448271 RepID=A0A285CSZ8_9BACI|nr:ABC-F type ribosomal protection protein [Bacillus oleivorans]SNX70545.1 ATPase subunit of ABC transporter with duplicated ATPase domains [Bacillus oleivorans]